MFELLMPFAVFGAITLVFAVPLAILLGFPLAAWLARSLLRIKERELALKEREFVLRLRESRAIPTWVDENDPRSLAAWVKSDRELAALEWPRG